MDLQARLRPRHIVTDVFKLLNIIFQHMVLSVETSVGRSARAFSRTFGFFEIF